MTIKKGAWPSGVPQDVKDFMEEFYHLSNASSTHNDHKADEERFASLFTSDGIYEFAGKKGTGHAGIKQLRHDLFKDIPHRDHPIIKLYVHGEDCLELMALGQVVYVYHTGQKHEKEWAGRYMLTKDGGGVLKFKYVGIIIDPTKQEGA